MTTPFHIVNYASLDILDYWTQVALESIWKEMVKECVNINLTGQTVTTNFKTGVNNK